MKIGKPIKMEKLFLKKLADVQKGVNNFLPLSFPMC